METLTVQSEVNETFKTKLRHRSYDEVENMFYSGLITADEWEYYVHRWRIGAFRYSLLGSGLCSWCGETH
jgi:hypothetical protein